MSSRTLAHLLKLICFSGDVEFPPGNSVGHPPNGDAEVPISLLVAGDAVVAQDDVFKVTLGVGHEKSAEGGPVAYDLKIKFDTDEVEFRPLGERIGTCYWNTA